jgi:ABC-type nitrate/sulfonate/bicarbonate transport system ATPase subunit
MATIDVQRVSKRFDRRGQLDQLSVLDDVSFVVGDREFVCLLGRSGCGKSTLLNMISGLDRDYDGTVAYDDAPARRDGRPPVRVGLVFQQPRLLPWLSVRDNVIFALRRSGLPSRTWRKQADDWVERVGLGEFAGAYPHELSGGMQQRASIARAFAIDPDVLLMDEPFSGLDEFTARAMREQVLALWRETRKTVVFVTHHCFEACYLADRILVLGGRPGRLVHDMAVEMQRPRDYDSAELFELSVSVTKLVTRSAAEATEERMQV